MKEKIAQGYLIAAVGQKYIQEGIHAAQSIKRHDPDAHITMVANEAVNNTIFDHFILDEIEEINHKTVKLSKPRAIDKSPYEKTFFVDTDVYFCDNCTELFDLVDHFDLLMVPSPADVLPPVIDNKRLEGCYPYNNGIMVMKDSEVMRRFMKEWIYILESDWENYKTGQSSVTYAIIKARVVSYALQPIYNFRVPFRVSFPPGKVKIIHGRAPDMTALANELNRSTQNRVWIPEQNKINVKKQESSLQRYWRRGWKKILNR